MAYYAGRVISLLLASVLVGTQIIAKNLWVTKTGLFCRCVSDGAKSFITLATLGHGNFSHQRQKPPRHRDVTFLAGHGPNGVRGEEERVALPRLPFSARTDRRLRAGVSVSFSFFFVVDVPAN